MADNPRPPDEYEQVGWLADTEDEYCFYAPDDDGNPPPGMPRYVKPVYRRRDDRP